MRIWRLTVLLALGGLPAAAASPSPLAARGYAVLPVPQRVTLTAADFRFGAGWRLERKNVGPGDVAVSSLTEGLTSRFHINLSTPSKSGTITLALARDSVTVGDALDSDKQAISRQAYRMELRPAAITITANEPAGLYYGVQTLLQLVRPREGAHWLPEGEIVDWPDLGLRQIYWDDAHHLDRPEALRAAIRQASFYKINGFAIKLEGHFQYRSAPAIVEPYALAPAELESLTDYALRYHVQLIPYLDGPAHIAFILKHPEYARLREFADSNYEACAVNPDVYKLYEGMFQDLLESNRGVKYFYLSTDEPYYIGLSHSLECDEVARAKELGSVGKVLAEFVTKTAGWLHQHGREVIFWGEYPMKPEDVGSMPPYIINGETYGPAFDPVFKRHGIRQTIYVSTQGEERHFPDYFPLPPEQRLHPETNRRAVARVEEIIRKISADPARKTADLIGVVNAGWADAGLHPETFWLGYVAGTAAAWHPAPPDADELRNSFYTLFYGWKAQDMERIYRLMSWQAQFWSDSWKTGPSQSRKPIWGNSNSIYNPRRPARDQFIPLPPVPNADLTYDSTWSRDNARLLELATEFLKQNTELRDLLTRNLQLADFNRYNLEVFLSIVAVLRQNLSMLGALGRMDTLLRSAQERAAARQPREATAALDQVLRLAQSVRDERDAVLRDLTGTWYQSWFPRVTEGNGRRFLHKWDDVKDHPADRTVDLSYMIQREFLLPFGEWVGQVRAARNQYAEVNQVHYKRTRDNGTAGGPGGSRARRMPDHSRQLGGCSGMGQFSNPSIMGSLTSHDQRAEQLRDVAVREAGENWYEIDVPAQTRDRAGIGDQSGLMLTGEKGQTRTRHSISSRESGEVPVLIMDGKRGKPAVPGLVQAIPPLTVEALGRTSLRPGTVVLRFGGGGALRSAFLRICDPLPEFRWRHSGAALDAGSACAEAEPAGLVQLARPEQ